MDEDEAYKLDAYRNEGSSDLVPCAKCGALISAYATRCPECGVHFDGVAYDFAPPTLPQKPRAIRWIARGAVAFVAVMAAAVLLLLCKC